MMYQSKKDKEVFAKLVSSDDKYKTSILEYTSGEKAGQTINVTDATLKRWWRKVDDSEVVTEEIQDGEVETVDVEQVAEEVLHVSVVDEETGKSVAVDISPSEFVPGVDDAQQTYDFNNQEKKHIPMPKAVAELYKLGDDPYPTVEELMDMLVSWGADIKAYREWIRLFDGTRIIFRRNKRNGMKSAIEIRMKVENIVDGFETVYAPVKSALIKDTPYVITVRTVSELEQVVKSLLAATK